MIRPPLRLQALCLLSAFSVGALPALRAQSQPTPTPAPAALEEETVVLSPFVVEASEDDGYRAKATLAGTRIRTELKDVGASVSAITEKFLQDTNSNRVEDLLVYTVGTEVAGQGGNYLGQGDSTFLTDTNRTSPIANTRVRGLAEADNTRDFFLSDIPWDSYNIGRVDLQRGPNSILFGIGSPAGIVNSSVNSAAFKNSGEIENVVSSYQSVRFSADLNRVLLQDELAVRASYLRDDAEFRQNPAFRNDHRTFFALRFDPKLLNGGSARTSLRVSYENGNVKSNLPRNTPPLDAITPWFNHLNQLTVDARVSNDVASTQPWLGAPGNRVFDGVITTFNDGGQGFAFPAKVQPWPDTGTPVPGTIVGNNGLKGIGSFDVFANRSGLPGSTISAFKARSLGDSSVFDFFNNLIEGPNKAEFNDFKAFNAALTQTFFHDKLGVEFAYDYQQARWGFANFLSGDGAAVTVDIISTLLDGTPNPNVGRPLVIAGGGSAGGYWEGRTRNTARVTAFADLDFRDLAGKDSFLGRVFGRNTLTGLYSTQHINDENRDYSRYYLANSFGPNVGQGAVGQASRDDIFYVYLGNSLLGQSTAAGIGLTGVKNALTPQPTNITVYNNLANTFQSIPLDIVNNSLASDDNKTYRRARKTRESIASTALVWQGYWFDGAVVPMIGYRHDNDNFKDAGNAPDLGGGLVNPQAPQWQLPDEGTVATGNSTTYSLVVHTPEFIKRHLPLGLDLGGFYNQSDNFQPKSGRRDIMGDAIANPAGKTKEWGLTLSALDDRVYLKAARYKTKVNNADVSGGIFGQYLIGANEAWGQRAAYKFKNETGTWPADTIYGLTSTGSASPGAPPAPSCAMPTASSPTARRRSTPPSPANRPRSTTGSPTRPPKNSRRPGRSTAITTRTTTPRPTSAPPASASPATPPPRAGSSNSAPTSSRASMSPSTPPRPAPSAPTSPPATWTGSTNAGPTSRARWARCASGAATTTSPWTARTPARPPAANSAARPSPASTSSTPCKTATCPNSAPGASTSSPTTSSRPTASSRAPTSAAATAGRTRTSPVSPLSSSTASRPSTSTIPTRARTRASWTSGSGTSVS